LTQWSFISHISWNTWTFKHPLFPFFFSFIFWMGSTSRMMSFWNY
jgi:hypothetical protein